MTKVVDLPQVEEVKSVEFDIKLDKALKSKQEKEDDFIEIISLSKQKRKGEEEEENISEALLQVGEEPLNVSIAATDIAFEMPNETISSLVNIYSSGRSDEKSKDSIEAPTSETSINVSETTKQQELKLKPLETEKKHIGYYEHLTTKALSETLEIPQPSIVQQTNPEGKN